MESNYRKLWFQHVATTRKKLSKKNNPCSHRTAMAKASVTWPKIKARLAKKAARAKKKAGKEVTVATDKSVQNVEETAP